MKKKTQRNIIIILAIIIAALTGIGVWLFLQYRDLTETKQSLQMELEQNTQTVYVATEFIEKGMVIDAQGEAPNVQPQTIRSGLEAYNYLTDEDLGKVAVVDIPVGIPVLYNMVAEEQFDKDTREYEISVVNLATDQKENDFVDVRIMFPNGEDYIVLPKKQIKNLSLENNVFTCNANEEEILRMSSAIVDAYTTSGAYIYSTRYVESNVQEDAIPNYPVKTETLDLINSDPNVLTKAIETLNLSARLSLETRLGTLTEDQLEAVAQGHGLQDTAKSSVLGSQGAAVSTEPDMSAPADNTMQEGQTGQPEQNGSDNSNGSNGQTATSGSSEPIEGTTNETIVEQVTIGNERGE